MKEIKVEKLDTIEQILSKGSEEDILNFIENKNIWNNKIFDFSDIYHLLEKESFYIKLVKILKKEKSTTILSSNTLSIMDIMIL